MYRYMDAHIGYSGRRPGANLTALQMYDHSARYISLFATELGCEHTLAYNGLKFVLSIQLIHFVLHLRYDLTSRPTPAPLPETWRYFHSDGWWQTCHKLVGTYLVIGGDVAGTEARSVPRTG